jgi:lactate dehydrogenase-like 2-hydroxyacid dehydrogenase
VVHPKPLAPQQLKDELRDAVAVMHGGEEWISRSALETASQLSIVAFLGIGYRTFVDVAAAAEFGTRVTNTPDRDPASVAEFTLWRIAEVTRRIRLAEDMPTSPWFEATDMPNPLAGYRIGIIGLGSIGTEIAKYLRVFGVPVAYYSKTRKRRIERKLGLTYLSLHDLASRSDVLVVMVPGNESTNNMVDDEVFRRMPEGSILVNTARAAVVDPAALDSALRSHKLSMVVFDGDYHDRFIYETLRPAFKDRVLFTPHVASQTRASMGLMVSQAVESIQKALDGKRDPNSVPGAGTIRRPVTRQ